MIHWGHWLLVLVASASTSLTHSVLSFDEGSYAPENVITRDVLVVGGGSCGTYAAVRLQQDFKKSVMVIEEKDTLGGHTKTYHDHATGSTVDMGVLIFDDLPLVREYFARFNIPLANMSLDTAGLVTVDFRTATPVALPFTQSEVIAALSRYIGQLNLYPTLSEGFVFPFPVPEDLLLPFEAFVRKYDLAAVVPIVWPIAQGYGDILRLPTLYILKAVGLQILQGLSSSFVTTPHHNNHEIYEKALQLLGNGTGVLLSSRIAGMARDLPGQFVHAVINTSSGLKLLRAKQVLFTIPPLLDQVSELDLDRQEYSLFSEFSSTKYYSGLLQHAVISAEKILSNMVDNPETFYLPRLPTTFTYAMNVPSNLTSVKFISNITSMTAAQVKTQIIAEARRVIPGSKPQLVAFISHAPFGLQVSANAIRDGFYQKLNRLQGRRRSFWTGAAFHVHDTALLWNFTESILAQMQGVQ